MVTLAAQMAVTRFGLSTKKLAPDVSRLSPLARLRELPRQNIPALIQALVLLPLFSAAVYVICRDRFAEMVALPLERVETGARQVGASLSLLLWRGAGLFMLFGCIDLIRQRRRFSQDLRMSRQEVREEFKETEGNPQMKTRIRRLLRDRIRRNMMKQVPTATAVIVNPTLHCAVAIRYEMAVGLGPNRSGQRKELSGAAHPAARHRSPGSADRKSALGAGALQISGNRTGNPPHLYRAVAEILGWYIYRLMHGRLPA